MVDLPVAVPKPPATDEEFVDTLWLEVGARGGYLSPEPPFVAADDDIPADDDAAAAGHPTTTAPGHSPATHAPGHPVAPPATHGALEKRRGTQERRRGLSSSTFEALRSSNIRVGRNAAIWSVRRRITPEGT